MNTVDKGDKLEKTIFDLFSNDIENDLFWARKECCRIFAKKGYYSKDREKDIVFDVSIEIYLPGQKHYSVLVLIECKNYNHRVPVDDVEEFYAKTQQISGANIKGILASTNSYQDGAFKFSRSKGIGLLRYFSPDKREWVLNRSPSVIKGRSESIIERMTVSQGLQDQEFKSKGFDFYCYSSGTYTNSTKQLISSLILQSVSEEDSSFWDCVKSKSPIKSSLVRYLEPDFIEEQCMEVLKRIKYFSGPVSMEALQQYVLDQHSVKVNFDANLDFGVLGSVNFEEGVINIDNQQCETEPRARFTLAHELGHLLLKHSEYMLGESCLDTHLVGADRTDIVLKDIMRMEWQANQFAASLLLPKKAFIKAFLVEVEKQGIVDRGFGLLFVDGQSCNQSTMHSISVALMKRFNVSKTVVIIRMKQLGIMREEVARA
ncbi:ImmA/IrrE family metallo-endopeptidase [Paraferrimonas sp. SM1919]|uniref:ImmA/IrrE family metallo-endopeptidase n=1 Tax=Paraferrimonas sp. SM1919 TaxID=2662263 RepID=UPI0013D06DDE|nr:ImmA/IrrE family metallo-endopeptidase [Paraferrimonas sp. SM1919]